MKRPARLIYGLLIASLCLQAAAQKPLSPDELVSLLRHVEGHSDSSIAHTLSAYRLTARTPDAVADERMQKLPGEKSRLALLALVDEAEFLPLSPAQIPAEPAPDFPTQQQIMKKVLSGIRAALSLHTNLLATRKTVFFQAGPMPGKDHAAPQLRSVGTQSVEIAFRDGMEELNGVPAESVYRHSLGLVSQGEFGPILPVIFIDAARNRLSWSHWESSTAGTLAVFQFSVPAAASHYNLSYCCIRDPETGRSGVYRFNPAYHGEFSVDLNSGAIRRLQIASDPGKNSPISRSDIVVIYKDLSIGGKSYLCPWHSIAVSRAARQSASEDILIGSGQAVVHTQDGEPGEELIYLNDLSYLNYHLFRTESRILSAESELPETAQTPNAPLPTSLPADPPPAAVSGPAAEPPAAPVQSRTLVTATGPPVERPDSSLPAPQAPLLTLHAESRLVDIPVLILDKKGDPVTTLTRDDFTVFDNGNPQQISMFTAPSTSTMPAISGVANHPPPASGSASSAASGNTVILLLDVSHIAFQDLNDTRQAIARTLQQYSAGDAVGIFLLRRNAIRILIEPTGDRNRVLTALAHFTPEAGDIAQGQSEEARNHQQVDYVANVSDLLQLNGRTMEGQAGSSVGKDPRLMAAGDDPTRNALLLLPLLATRLNKLPGHKVLLWISTDNALISHADQPNPQSSSYGRLDPFFRQAQESLNNAQTTLFVLDASALEAGGVSAERSNASVQLNPASNELAQSRILPGSQQSDAAEALQASHRNTLPSRATAQIRQDLQSISPEIRGFAEATGGEAFRRSSDLPGTLQKILAHDRASYQIGFIPGSQADDAWHTIQVKVRGKHLTLHYRAGYFYAKSK